MPGPLVKRNELNDLTIAANQQMRRDFQTGDLGKVIVCGRIQLPGKQGFDEPPAKFTRRKTDVMNHDQTDIVSVTTGVAKG
jgi:hypothetical protein